MRDADTFGYDEWAFGCCQVPPSSCLFTVASVQVIMKCVREARNMPFHQKHKLSCQQWHRANTAELSYFLLFYRARHTKRGFSSLRSLLRFNAILYLIFLACASLLWESAPGMTEHKATSSDFSVLYCTNKVSIRLWMWACAASAMSWTYETLHSDSDRYSAHQSLGLAQ